MPKTDAEKTWLQVKFQIESKRLGDVFAALPSSGLRELDVQKVAANPLRNGAARAVILELLSNQPKATLDEIRAAMTAAGGNAKTVANTLTAAKKAGVIKRVGPSTYALKPARGGK